MNEAHEDGQLITCTTGRLLFLIQVASFTHSQTLPRFGLPAGNSHYMLFGVSIELSSHLSQEKRWNMCIFRLILTE